ncbi:hypothetical protein NDU88_000268, partial [Pleurodeles waltl]
IPRRWHSCSLQTFIGFNGRSCWLFLLPVSGSSLPQPLSYKQPAKEKEDKVRLISISCQQQVSAKLLLPERTLTTISGFVYRQFETRYLPRT